MSNPIESNAVKAWLVGIGQHEYFPFLMDGIRMFNRMDGWDQTSEWMEMKANGYRCGFEEAIEGLKNLVDENFQLNSSNEETQTELDFFQDDALADHVSGRF